MSVSLTFEKISKETSFPNGFVTDKIPLFKVLPTFGFESEKVNAKEVYEKIREGYRITNNTFDISWKITNKAKIIGYAPLLGVIAGYNRIHAISNPDVKEIQNNKLECFRGLLEIVGAVTCSSFILLGVLDLAATLKMRYKVSKRNSLLEKFTEIKQFALDHHSGMSV